jgi:hypothetical protein
LFLFEQNCPINSPAQHPTPSTKGEI